MGQRFQSVFILPSVNMGECDGKENPNNRSEKVLIFHSQWLYGKGALNVNLQIMERLKEAIKEKEDCGQFAKTKQGYKNHFLEKDLINAIAWASVQELHRETRFSENGGFIYSEEEGKPKEEQNSLSKILKYQDNNNGFFICEIQENLNIKYCFISGLEDTEEHKYKTPKEYLELFYSRNDLIKEGSLEAIKKVLHGFKKFIRTPKEDFKIILKEMNQ